MKRLLPIIIGGLIPFCAYGMHTNPEVSVPFKVIQGPSSKQMVTMKVQAGSSLKSSVELFKTAISLGKYQEISLLVGGRKIGQHLWEFLMLMHDGSNTRIDDSCTAFKWRNLSEAIVNAESPICVMISSPHAVMITTYY